MGMAVKILIVSPVFWPEAFRINDVARQLVAAGHEVEVLAGHPNYPEGRYFPGYTCWGPWSENWKGSRITRRDGYVRQSRLWGVYADEHL